MDFLNNKEITTITGKINFFEKKTNALCNEVYFLNAQNGKYILKIASDETRKIELEKENNLLNKFSNIISVPNVLLYKSEKECSYILMNFIKGEKINYFSDKILKKMAKALKNLHKVKCSTVFVDYDKLLEIAQKNLDEKRIDYDEFNINGKYYEPTEILDFLKNNKTKTLCYQLHGDFRPKNMILSNNKLYLLDFGLSFCGDFYYDLAIIKWYLTYDEFKSFLHFYGLKKLDYERLFYNEALSWFLNV